MRYVGLASLSGAVLLLELTLTRIYSVTQGYHFAFLAVSLGLLGFGVSGTVLFVAPHQAVAEGQLRTPGEPRPTPLFSVTSIGSFWLLNEIPFDAYQLLLEPVVFLHLALFYLTPAVPFILCRVGPRSGDCPWNPGKREACTGPV